MIDFVFERYNYWIFIVLMMVGLYIVISRGNLVKKLIGLNLFQTSVFVYYISIGKIVGGTAPILIGGHGDDHSHSDDHGHGDSHTDGHGADHHMDQGDGHSAAPESAGYGAAHSADAPHQASAPHNDGEPSHGAEGALTHGSSEGAPTAEIAADLAALTAEAPSSAEPISNVAIDAAMHAARCAGGVDEACYTNPLPHVLILTAIVVGVATTAVGLSLAVRIREAYGTIEEDELIVDDHYAQFGDAGPEIGGAET